MPFLFEFYLNKEQLHGVEIGFSTSRKWEEALDEAKLALPFYTSIDPLPMFGLLQITITEIDNYVDKNEIETKSFDMLIISDTPSLSSQYGYYRHDIVAIEYTAKLDAYIMASLAKTRSIENILPAKFEITDDGNYLNYFVKETEVRGQFYANVFLPPFTVNQTYFVNKVYTFSQVAQAYQVSGDSIDGGHGNPYTRVPTVFRIYNETTDTYSSWYDLSADDVDITFTSKGKYQIEYGLDATTWQTSVAGHGYTAQEYAIYRFYFSVIDKYQVTIGDVVRAVRQNVSKGGGIESEYFYDDTRIFDIDATLEAELDLISAPQMYLENATARQMLIFALSYVNAVPRLEYGETIDTLNMEKFNLSTGDYTEENIFEKSGHQNTNQIGTRSYSALKQVLPNNMDESTIYSPSQNGYQQARATDLQITDATFSIKLPKPIYTPKELSVLLPRITISAARVDETLTTVTESDYTENINIPLTTRLISIDEWKLKYITDNFPTITTKTFWDQDLGLRENMVDNIYWELGSKVIQISDVYGQLVNKTLISNVIKLGIFEYFMLNMFTPFTYMFSSTNCIYAKHIIDLDLDFLTDDQAYKDLRFRFSYLSLEDVVTKLDKQDTSQISFYSEMRQNQDESILNVVRGSRKHFGDLQRIGNREFSFQKVHHSFSEMYQVGMKDSENYTITAIETQYFANYLIATYFATKYHNRDSRLMVVDQTYRWRDNYAKNALVRHEHYGDYVVLYRPDYAYLVTQHTKIYLTGTITKLFGVILGRDMGTNTKATSALVRTDGMFENDPEVAGYNYAISTPVSAYPIRNGLAFTFGFESNLVAGDGLVQRGDNWYNQAVRYTDEQGRFTKLWFAIIAGITLDSDDYETYPKITRTSLSNLSSDLEPYFYCGALTKNTAGEDPLIVDKDPLTNYNQTYNVNMLSYETNLYIFGQAFFNDNYLVNNPDYTKAPYLYLYKNGEKYGLFEDLLVKSGYVSSTLLTSSNFRFTTFTHTAVFVGINLTNVTSWAIGDQDGNLYLACNEGLNGFMFNREHYRIQINEIGKKVIYYEQPVPEIADNIVVAVNFLDSGRLDVGYFFQDNPVISVNFVDTDRLSVTMTFNESEVISVAFRDSDRLTVSMIFRDDTVEPTIAFTNYQYIAPNHRFTFLVTNNDSITAEIFADANATPTTSRGNVASGSSTSFVITNTTGASVTIYARAKATDKNYSTVDSAVGTIV